MSARESRRQLGETARAAYRAGVPATRGGRLAARLAGRRVDRPSLPDLASWPTWPGASDEEQARVWRIAALIAAHDAVGDVIDGERLRGYAALVGDAALEAVLALPAGGTDLLAAPERLADAGREVARRGLPPALAALLGVTAPHGDAERDHILCAERIARELPA